jgi:hypothetical protein
MTFVAVYELPHCLLYLKDASLVSFNVQSMVKYYVRLDAVASVCIPFGMTNSHHWWLRARLVELL